MKGFEEILKALANRRRLNILKFIRTKRECSVSEIAAHLRLSFKATSRHISILHRADLVEREQRSTLAFYSLNSESPKFVIVLIKHL